jgi:hypothetical protein
MISAAKPESSAGLMSKAVLVLRIWDNHQLIFCFCQVGSGMEKLQINVDHTSGVAKLLTSSMTEGNASIAYLTVKISPEGISEVHKGRVAVFLPRSEIRHIALTSGSGAENPTGQIILSVVLLIIGGFGFVPMLAGNFTMLRFKFGFSLFGLMGAWFVWEVIRKRTYLLVQTRSIKRKVFFKGTIQPESMEKFLRAAETDFGYTVIQNASLPPEPASTIPSK